MAKNKFAQKRLKIIDGALGKRRSYTCEELTQMCCNTLGCKIDKRTIQNDIKEIKDRLSEIDANNQWENLLEITHEKPPRYSYVEENFSLWNQALTQQEKELLVQAIDSLGRFSGRPTFEWLDSIKDRLKLTSKLEGRTGSVISYSDNIVTISH